MILDLAYLSSGEVAPVYYYFRKWKFEGVIEDMMGSQSGDNRLPERQDLSPRDPFCKGMVGNKKVKGGKEHVVGLHDSKGAVGVIERLDRRFLRLWGTLADGGYRGGLGDWVTDRFGWDLEAVPGPTTASPGSRCCPRGGA